MVSTPARLWLISELLLYACKLGYWSSFVSLVTWSYLHFHSCYVRKSAPDRRTCEQIAASAVIVIVVVIVASTVAREPPAPSANARLRTWSAVDSTITPIRDRGIWYQRPGPIFCLLLGVSSDYAQPITGQVTSVTCPVIGRAQPELTPSKRQKTGPDGYMVGNSNVIIARNIMIIYNNILKPDSFRDFIIVTGGNR